MKTRSWHDTGWKSFPVCVVSKLLLTGVWTCLFIASCPAAIVLSIDYSLDENGFFSGDEGGSRKAALEMACEAFEGIFSDHLLPIVPDEGNTWSAMGFHPATGDPGVLAEHTTFQPIRSLFLLEVAPCPLETSLKEDLEDGPPPTPR